MNELETHGIGNPICACWKCERSGYVAGGAWAAIRGKWLLGGSSFVRGLLFSIWIGKFIHLHFCMTVVS